MQPLLLLVCISLTLALPDRGARWTNYKNTHKRTFQTVEEETQRRAIWEKNLIELDAHNQKHAAGQASFSVAENFLTDKTAEERKAYLGRQPILTYAQALPTTTKTTTKPTTQTTAKPTTQTTAKPTTQTTAKPTTQTTAKPTTQTTAKPTTQTTAKPTTQTTAKPTTQTTAKPTTQTTAKLTTTTTKAPVVSTAVDYRNGSCLAPIKDQGQCGSCYAFTATAALEYYNCKKKGSLVIGSEQEIVDCDTSDSGCNGGLEYNAWNYLKSIGGMCSGAAYSYTSGVSGVAGTCKKGSCTPALTVSGYVNLPIKNETLMMETVAKVGPIAVGIYASSLLFGGYSGGVFDDASCNSVNMDHSVLIVGYTTMNNIPVWIVRNHWTTGWGVNGYMYVKRGVNMCAIAMDPSYPVV